MMKIWNPIEAYRRQASVARRHRHATRLTPKFASGTTPTARERHTPALIIDGIPVQRVTADNIQSCEKQLCSVRQEYIDKRTATAAV